MFWLFFKAPPRFFTYVLKTAVYFRDRKTDRKQAPIQWFSPLSAMVSGDQSWRWQLNAGFPYKWLEPNYLSYTFCLPECSLAGSWSQELRPDHTEGFQWACQCLRHYRRCPPVPMPWSFKSNTYYREVYVCMYIK